MGRFTNQQVVISNDESLDLYVYQYTWDMYKMIVDMLEFVWQSSQWCPLTDTNTLITPTTQVIYHDKPI